MSDAIIKTVVDKSVLVNSINNAFNSSRFNKPVSLRIDTRGASQPLGRIKADLAEFDKSLDAASARVLAFGASVGIINGVRKAFSDLVKETVAVEDALANINVILSANTEQLDKFGGRLFDIARNTKQTFSAAAEAATEFSRQGLSIEETLQRTNDAMILTRLSGLELNKSVETLTATINGFGNAALDSSDIIDRLAKVDAAFAVSSKDLSDALSRAGSTAQDAGVSLNELLALTTAVQEQTARGGAVIGNAFKTIFARISRGTSIDQLRELGVAIDETQGGVQKLKAIGAAINSSNELTANKIKEIAGGVRQINIVSAAFRDLNKDASTFGKALDQARDSAGAATERNEQLNQTVATLIESTKTGIQELYTVIGDLGLTDSLKGVFTFLNSSIGNIVELLDGDKVGSEFGEAFKTGAIIGIKGVIDFATGPLVITAISLFVKLFKQISKDSFDAFKAIAGLNTKAEKQKNTQKIIESILTSQNGQYQSLLRSATTMAEKENVVLNILNQQVAAKKALEASVRTLSASKALQGFGLSPKGGVTKTAASGFLPSGSGIADAIDRERVAITKGVGGASAGAKPIVIPKFDFGDGKTGPIVANSDEYILKDADGQGGSAVLTKQMVEDLGGPKAVERLGGTRVPYAADGNAPFNLANSRAQSATGKSQFISQERVDKLNEVVRDFKKAFDTGDKRLLERAKNLKESLSPLVDPKTLLKLEKETKARVNKYESQPLSGKERLRFPKTAPTVPEPLSVSEVSANELEKLIINSSGQRRKNSINESLSNGSILDDYFGAKTAEDQKNALKSSARKIRTAKSGAFQHNLSEVGFSEDQIKKVLKKDLSEFGDATKRIITVAKREADLSVKKLVDAAKTDGFTQQKIRNKENLDRYNAAVKDQSKVSKFKSFRNTGSSVAQLPEFKELSRDQQISVLRSRTIKGRAGNLGKKAIGSAGSALKNPLGISFAASLAGSALESASANAGGNSTRAGKALNISSDIAQFAAMGALFGPWGAGIGAVVGGIKGFIEVNDAATNSITSLSEEMDKQKAKSTALINSIVQIQDAQSRFFNLIGTGGSQKEIDKSRNNLTSTVSALGDEGVIQKINNILLGPEKDKDNVTRAQRIGDVLNEVQNEANRLKGFSETALFANELEKENRGRLNVGGIFGEQNLNAGDIGKLATSFSSAISSLDENKIKEIKDSFEAISSTETFDGEKFKKALKNAGLTKSQNKGLRTGLGEDGDGLQFVQESLDKIFDKDKLDKSAEAAGQYYKSLSESNKTLSKLVDNTNRLSRIRAISAERGFNQKQNSQQIKFATATFNDPFTKGIVDLNSSIDKIKFTQEQSAIKLTDSLRTTFGKISVGDGTSDDVRNILSKYLDQSFQADGGTIDSIISQIDGLGRSETEEIVKLHSTLNDAKLEWVETNQISLAQLDVAQKNFEISRAQKKEQQRQHNVGFLGGASSLLDTSSDRFNDFTNRRRLANGSEGSLNAAAKGIIDVVKNFKDVGVDIRKYDPSTEAVVEKAVANKLTNLKSSNPEFKDLDVAAITRDMVENIFGDDKLTPKNLAEEISKIREFSGIEDNTGTTAQQMEMLVALTTKNIETDSLRRQESLIKTQIKNKQTEFDGNFAVAEKTAQDNLRRSVSSSSLTDGAETRNGYAFAFDDAAIKKTFGGFENFDERIAKVLAERGGPEGNHMDRLRDDLNKLLRRHGGNIGGILNNADDSFAAQVLEEFEVLEGGLETFSSGLTGLNGLDFTELTLAIENVAHRFNKAQEEIALFNNAKEKELAVVQENLNQLNNQKVGETKGGNFDLAPVYEFGNKINEIFFKSHVEAAERFLKYVGVNFLQGDSDSKKSALSSAVTSSGSTGIDGERVSSAINSFEQSVIEDMSDRELSEALGRLDDTLESLGSDLDIPELKEYIKSLSSRITDSNASEAGRIVGNYGRAVKDTSKLSKTDLFTGDLDISRIKLEAIGVVEEIKRTKGETKEAREAIDAFKKSYKEVSGIDLDTSAWGRFALGAKTATEEINANMESISEMGRRVTGELVDGFSEAFVSAVEGSANAEDSIRSLFSSIFRNLAKMQAEKAFSKIFEAIGGDGEKSDGGGLNIGKFVTGLFSGSQKHNSGGKVLYRNSGGDVSGGKKVPTLLTGGEFVAGPDLVNKYGKNFFDNLNRKTVDSNTLDGNSLRDAPVGQNSTGMVKGGSGTRDDRFHMLHSGSYVLNKAATKKYQGILGSVQRGEDVNQTGQRPQKAFLGALIGQILGHAATGAVVGGITSKLSGGSFSDGAKIGAIGGAIGGAVNFTANGGFGGAFDKAGSKFLGNVGGNFKDTVGFGAFKSKGPEGGIVQEASSPTAPTPSSDYQSKGLDQFESDPFGLHGDSASKQNESIFSKSLSKGSSENKKGVFKQIAEGLINSTVLTLLSNATAPKVETDDGSIPYEAGFVTDIMPDGTVKVASDGGVQSFKMGPDGDIQTIDQLKGIVDGYSRGGFVPLKNFASSEIKDKFLDIVSKKLGGSTDTKTLETHDSFKYRAKSFNPVSRGVDEAVRESLSIRGIQKLAKGGNVFSRPSNPVIMGGINGVDSVPSLLKKGEFVTKDSSVDFFGQKFMHSINNRDVSGAKKELQRFSQGGSVQRSGSITNSPEAPAAAQSSTGDTTMSGSITIDVNFNNNGDEGAKNKKEFNDYVTRLEPAIKKVISEEARNGGIIHNVAKKG